MLIAHLSFLLSPFLISEIVAYRAPRCTSLQGEKKKKRKAEPVLEACDISTQAEAEGQPGLNSETLLFLYPPNEETLELLQLVSNTKQL